MRGGMRIGRLLSLLLPVALFVSLGGACGDDPPPAAPSPKEKPKAVAAAPAAPRPAAPQTAEDLRKKVLKDEDFVESPGNRDPFHNLVGELTARGERKVDYFVFFDKYACEELRLIAIASGGLDPRALFRDPSGLGIPLKVGDHMCRARWKIKRIVAEGVVVELEQDTGGVKPKLVERMIAINPGDEAAR